MTLRRELARLRGQLEARYAPPPVVCQDAVDLWKHVMPGEPDPWQQAVMTSQHPRILLNCCRQSGKSTVAAIGLGLYEALYRPPALVLLLSASLRQAQELGLKLFTAYRQLGRPISPEAENRLSLELANGSRIVCLPSKESTIRGLSGVRLLLVDEAARVPDEAIYATKPMLAVSGGRMVMMSTPWGQRGAFFKAWMHEPEWWKIEIPATMCPRISPEFLAQEHRDLPEWSYLSEYCCAFTQTELNVFSAADLAAFVGDGPGPLMSGFTFEAWKRGEWE